MKKRMNAMMQMMLIMTAIPTNTVAALKAGDKIVPKSSSLPLHISVPSWLKLSQLLQITGVERSSIKKIRFKIFHFLANKEDKKGQFARKIQIKFSKLNF